MRPALLNSRIKLAISLTLASRSANPLEFSLSIFQEIISFFNIINL
jgi:hypothetical protein